MIDAPGKVTDAHLRRRAVVYVRQSTPGQVERNTESAARQYALNERALDLGWAAEGVFIVDEDTGLSGASTAERFGFQELVADVGLGRVGVVLSLEVSRLARSSADWHQLLDLCALTDTLIADADGIYSPGHFNDRLLLGLKGTMSEAELHLIRSRLRGGIESKARRGELRLNLPIGLERDADGRICLSVDEQVRAAIEHVHVLWRRCGSVRQVVALLHGDGIRLPRRHVGEQDLRWEPPAFGAVHDLLTNPVYAGAFVYGRSRQVRSVGEDGRVKTRTETVPMEQWSVCLPDHHPGYVTWDEYLATLARLRANTRPTGEGGGAAREGHGLLQGIIRCGQCGRRMRTAYSGKGHTVSYLCDRTSQLQATTRTCQRIGGLRLDRAVAASFLEVISPAAVTATSEAVEELARQHEARTQQQRLALERAEYETGRARRRYEACDPDNRLVARTLERALEETLAAVERERHALQAVERTQPAPLTETERRAVSRLARALPRVWEAPTTTDRDRKELLRALVTEVVLTVDRTEGRARLEIFWEGGATTELAVALNTTSPKRTDTPTDLVTLITRLASQHDAQIAAVLSRQGRLTATGLPFTAARVAGIRERAHIPAAPPPDPESQLVSIRHAAEELSVSTQTIRRWLAEGLLAGEQLAPHAPFRIRLDDDVRQRFIADVPDGYLALRDAAQTLGVARQTVLNQVRRGERRAIHVTNGRRGGLRIEVRTGEGQLFE